MDRENLEKLLEKCVVELHLSSTGDCEPIRAEKNAALFLEMQMRLAEHISDSELKAKRAKNEIERASSQKYFEYKNGALGSDKKMTEAALEHLVTKDEEIYKLKEEMIKFEIEYKKYHYMLNILSNGHIFYRNLGKRDFST